MSFYKKLCCRVFLAATCLTQLSYAAGETDHARDLNTKDDKALREFLASKRSENVADDKTSVIISGDIRAEYSHLRERVDGFEVYGCKTPPACLKRPLSGNDFDIEANLWLNAEYGRAWAVANLQFDNSAGVKLRDGTCDCDVPDEDDCRHHLYRFQGSGVFNKLNLKRAYVGYNIYEGCGELDVEIGRRRLYDFFESDIQFLSTFDGISLKYADTWECVSDWYIKAAGFLVDENVNQFAWAAEVAMFNICDSSFDVKYSFIDWCHHGRSRCSGCYQHSKDDPRYPYNKFYKAFNYKISQVLVNYTVSEDLLCIPTLLYGAALYNHDCKNASQPADGRHQGFGYYTGILFGDVEVAGDWSLEFEWQYVQRNAVPFTDQGGITLNNALEDCCNSKYIGVGYQGWQVDFLYAITDNLSINMIFETAKSNERARKSSSKSSTSVATESSASGASASSDADKKCNTHHLYSKLELEVIYAF